MTIKDILGNFSLSFLCVCVYGWIEPHHSTPLPGKLVVEDF